MGVTTAPCPRPHLRQEVWLPGHVQKVVYQALVDTWGSKS